MPRMTLVLLGFLVLALVGCDEDGAGEAETDEGMGSDTGLTGALDEKAFKALHDLSEEERPAPTGTMIELAGGAKAYLSLPKDGKAPLPAIVLIHEWWGLNQHIKYWADRLAAAGYAALAVDLYEGKVATTRDEAMSAMRGVDDAKGLAAVKAAHAFLGSDPRIKAKKRGCVGWCFGGGWSLKLALAAPDLDAAVIYYGRLETDPAKLAPIKAKIIGVFGNLDRGIPPATVDAFEAGLKKAGVDARILRYDANHAFANPSSGRYDQKAATAAWKEVEAFFKTELR